MARGRGVRVLRNIVEIIGEFAVAIAYVVLIAWGFILLTMGLVAFLAWLR